MSDDDLNFIESELAIKLPTTYRSAVNPFPVEDEYGNFDLTVWDNAAALIELNFDLRHFQSWPEWLFAIGQAEGDPSGYAIDVRRDPPEIWWIDHLFFDPNSGPIQQLFTDWFTLWVNDNLTTPTNNRTSRFVLGGCIVFLVVIVGIFMKLNW